MHDFAFLSAFSEQSLVVRGLRFWPAALTNNYTARVCFVQLERNENV